jgi:XTP/dITP diphosphohydrolase
VTAGPHGSGGPSASGQALLDFLADMRRLRAECPWKRAQTHRSLARYLQEEAYETLEAIDSGDDDHLREELGDLLLQVYFHAVIAEETQTFTIDDVAAGIAEKMHRRNPHVFGSATPSTMTPDEVNQQWQDIKAAERRGDGRDAPERSPYQGVAADLPALLLATKVLERTPEAAQGLPVPGDPSAELGDRLLAVVAEARTAGLDPEQALRDAVRRAVRATAR